jgi:lysophospholipase L1-like esterase
LSATKFLAFGDSITEGKSGACVRTFAWGLETFVQDPFSLLTTLVPPGENYPTMLETTLTLRYTTQTISVLNEGLGGESVTGSTARARLNTVLNAHAPQVLLLQHGVNDLHSGVQINALVSALRTLVLDARVRGVRVFLGTLLPERTGSCRAFAPDLIVPANTQIAAMAAADGVPIVDLYRAFDGLLPTLLDEDGLHPTRSGYIRIAQTFFDAIRFQLEVAPPSPTLGAMPMSTH